MVLASLHSVYIFHCAKMPLNHHVTTMLATSKNVLFPGHNHLLTTGADDSTLIITQAPARLI